MTPTIATRTTQILIVSSLITPHSASTVAADPSDEQITRWLDVTGLQVRPNEYSELHLMKLQLSTPRQVVSQPIAELDDDSAEMFDFFRGLTTDIFQRFT
ncbi:jg7134 [Pararge aegeria aegeria]|uniref:Jg7134 protein n=1 Tax=Pararge aegeria aegeria TaxID=348720 RepID=A0A8S4SGT1_9NEOP|nr:jg7134 [Pararge aegeria aegeria]